MAKRICRKTWSPVQDGSRESCSLETPSTEDEVDALIDSTFAELNRRLGHAWFSPGQRVSGRQLRLPSSLLEDDFIDPCTIAQDANHEVRRIEAMRLAAAHGCVVAANRRAMDDSSPQSTSKATAGRWWQEKPVFMGGRKDGAPRMVWTWRTHFE